MTSPSWSWPLPPLGIRYNATMDERRYTPRAHLDEGGDRYTNRAVLLSSSQEHCDRITFHVLVSLTPSSPASRTQAPIGRGPRAGGGAAAGQSRSLAGASGPQEATRGLCPGLWPPHTQAPGKSYSLPPDSALLRNSFFPTCQVPKGSPAGDGVRGGRWCSLRSSGKNKVSPRGPWLEKKNK